MAGRPTIDTGDRDGVGRGDGRRSDKAGSPERCAGHSQPNRYHGLFFAAEAAVVLGDVCT